MTDPLIGPTHLRGTERRRPDPRGEGDQAHGALGLERAEPLDDVAARKTKSSVPAYFDGDEITDLRWFTRDEMRTRCEAGTVRIPPRLSIARRLIEHWYGAELPGSWSRP